MSLTHLLFGGPSAPKVDVPRLEYARAKGAGGRRPVDDSDDLKRVLALPRRPRPTVEQQRAMAARMTAQFQYTRASPCDCDALNPTARGRGLSPCLTAFKPIQGWYLTEAEEVGGAVGFIIVGGGKTGVDIMVANVLPLRADGKPPSVVLLLPNSLVDQFNRDFKLWSQHFRTPNLAGSNGPFDPKRPTLRVLKYSELSRPNFATWLKTMDPDAVICDEAQSLKDPKSVRTDRYLRYCEEANRRVYSFYHSGSLTTRGIQDFSHMAALALGDGSPAPIDPNVADEWGTALNPAVGRAPAPDGALRALCKPGEKARIGFQRRLVETKGVITTEDSELGVRLRIHTRDPGPVPEIIEGALAMPRQRNKRPDGEELVEKIDVVKVCRQLSSGFFYRWRYPHVYDAAGNEVEDDAKRADVIDNWFLRRQEWNRELRTRLEDAREDNLDSPALLTNAAERYHRGGDGLKWNARCYVPWTEVADRVEYEKETQWIDDFLVRDAAKWLAEAPGIAWYWHRAFGERLAELTGLPFYAGKNDALNLRPTPAMQEKRAALVRIGEWKENAANWLGVEDGSRAIICGIKPFHFGVNLQPFNRALVCNSPSDGGIWEQMLGRLHREGQTAEAVDVWVYRHTPEVAAAVDDAKEYAKYTREVSGKAEKLLYAEYDGRGEPDPS